MLYVCDIQNTKYTCIFKQIKAKKCNKCLSMFYCCCCFVVAVCFVDAVCLFCFCYSFDLIPFAAVVVVIVVVTAATTTAAAVVVVVAAATAEFVSAI